MAQINPAAARRRAMVFGGAVLAMFVVVLWLAITAGGGIPGRGSTTVRAAFEDVGSLAVGDDVRIGNVRAGRVSEIALEQGRPVVTLAFDEEREIYRNASANNASINARSSLGQKYVDFNPGDPRAGEMDLSQVIPATKTRRANDIADLLEVLDKPTRDALRTTLRELGGGAAGHQEDLADAAAALPGGLKDLGGVSRAFAADNGDGLRTLLAAADDLADSFAGQQQQLAELTENLATTLQSISVDDGQAWADVLDRAPVAMRRARGALESLHQPLADTELAMAQLRPGAKALGHATPDLRGVFREAIRPLQKVPRVAGQAKPSIDRLSGFFKDARPLAPQISKAVSRAREPVEYLSPYAPEIPALFTYLGKALGHGDSAVGGNWLRLVPLFHTESLSGASMIPDPLTRRNAYPEPGQAAKDRTIVPTESPR